MGKQETTRSILRLFTNHLDAWGTTFVILTVFFEIHDAFTPKGIALLVSITAMYWLGFALNDFYDAPYDALDTTKSQRNVFVQNPLLKPFFLFLAAAAVIPTFIVFAQFGWLGVIVFVFSCMVLWAYSAPPIRLKNRPVIDLLTHTMFVETYPYFLCLLLLDPRPTLVDGCLLTLFALASLAAQLEQQIRDVKIDAKLECTFTTAFGVAISSRLLKIATAGMFVGGTIGLLTGVIPLWSLPLIIIGLPAVLHRFFRPNYEPRPERLIRWSIVAGMVYAATLWLV